LERKQIYVCDLRWEFAVCFWLPRESKHAFPEGKRGNQTPKTIFDLLLAAFWRGLGTKQPGFLCSNTAIDEVSEEEPGISLIYQLPQILLSSSFKYFVTLKNLFLIYVRVFN
jgi:hypothetical protein